MRLNKSIDNALIISAGLGDVDADRCRPALPQWHQAE